MVVLNSAACTVPFEIAEALYACEGQFLIGNCFVGVIPKHDLYDVFFGLNGSNVVTLDFVKFGQ